MLVDWEHPQNPEQGHAYLQLLQAVRYRLPSPQYILTSALPAGEWALRHINLRSASTFLNMINLMAYDFAGPWTPSSGHHAQLYHNPSAPESAHLSGALAVQYILSQAVSPDKIVLGIPAYGRSFLGTTGPNQKCQGHGGNEGSYEYCDLPVPGSAEYVDENLVAACCIGGEGGFISYDNPRTVTLKAQFVKQQRLGGIFFWTGTGDSTRQRSIIQTTYKVLHDL
jgi:chitinase